MGILTNQEWRIYLNFVTFDGRGKFPIKDRVSITVLNQAQLWVEHQIEVWRSDFSDEENLELEEEKLEKEIVHLEDELTAIIECPGKCSKDLTSKDCQTLRVRGS